MHIRVNPTAVADALARVVPYTAKRTVLPILQAVKVEASGDTLTLSATAMDSAIRYIVPGVETLRDGVAVIPARPIQQLLRHLDEYDEVELDASPPENGYGKATLKFPNGVYRLDTYDPTDYPPMDFQVKGDGVSVSVIGSDLAQALKFVSAFVGAQSYWQATDVIWLTLRDGELWVAGTDRHKLGLARIPADSSEGNLNPQIYLSATSATALASLCGNNPNITVRFNAQTLIAERGRWQVRINGREASLNFETVLKKPMERATTVELASTQPILNFLQKVSAFDHQRTQRRANPAAGMHIKVDATEAGLELEAHARENWGEELQLVGRTQVSVSDFNGVPTTVWVSRRLLAETLQAFKGYKVKVGLEAPTKDSIKPLIVTALDTEPLKLIALLMPLTVTQGDSDTTDADQTDDQEW